MEFHAVTRENAIAVLLQFLLAVAFENVAEYYWHRMMHTKLFYATFHKYHHWYKAPEPWDDMYIHPLEAFGYYCILYGPPFLFRVHVWAFAAYMAVMGVCGILDHSGIRFELPGVYNTADHDNHHLKFEVNYAFPLPYMDILHGTFEGELLGYKFKASKGR
jgi:sterol desaturase/sphingolipid hydroxylase (fatty acid hydroxylase superfamily)